MTITTVERLQQHQLRRTLAMPSRVFRLAPLTAAMLLAAPAHADWRIAPTLSVTETYTDNVNLRSDELKRSEFVSQVTPGVTVFRESRRLSVSATAQWHQFAYLHNSGRDSNDGQRQYAGVLRGTVIDDMLFVDASASRGLRSVSAFGPNLSNDLYNLGNRAEVSTWSISPSLMHRFGNTANLQARYSRDSVESSRSTRFGNSTSDNASVILSSGSGFQTIGWGTNYYRQDLDNGLTGKSTTEMLGANLRYHLNSRIALTANAGYDRYRFEGPGGMNEGRNWSGGFIWTPSQRTRLEASLGRHFFGQTGSLAANHRSRRTTWNINYSDGITTSRSQFLLPATIDTAALLDGLFSASFPDPVERERIVAAYIAANGLPPSLADSVNYLSNRFMRQKMLRGSMAYRLARSSAVINAYVSDRVALSDQQSDSPLLGSQLSSLNNNVRQRGINASYTYQLNSRTSAIASWNLRRSRSLTTEIEDLQRTYRIGMTRRWDDRMLGVVELRHRTGGSGLGFAGTPGNQGNPGYTENAVSASLSMQF